MAVTENAGIYLEWMREPHKLPFVSLSTAHNTLLRRFSIAIGRLLCVDYQHPCAVLAEHNGP